VAATLTTLAVSQDDATSARVLLYSVPRGTLLRAVGGAPLAAGNTCCAGTQLGQPSGLRFSQDGSIVHVAEGASGRVTKWRVADGAYLGTLGTSYARPLDVQECFDIASGTAGGTVASFNASRVDVALDGSVASASGALGGSPAGLALVPGLGVLVALQAPSRVALLSSVVIVAHPSNASVVVGANTTFTVGTSGSVSGLTYVWTRNGSTVGGNFSSYTYTGLDSDAGSVSSIVCSVTHALGQAVSNPGLLSVVWVRIEAHVLISSSLTMPCRPCCGMWLGVLKLVFLPPPQSPPPLTLGPVPDWLLWGRVLYPLSCGSLRALDWLDGASLQWPL
jgi:hypothetical protein